MSITREILEKIFRDPKTKYELLEFEDLGQDISVILDIFPKTVTTGKDAGKTKYFIKSFVPFSSGKQEIQVYDPNGKSNPEEIVRQLWLYKLINLYEYKIDEIEVEKSVHFGTEVNTKAADIVVYTNNKKQTPKIIIEVKKPKRKDGIEQLKSYLNAEGSPIGLWSNGSERIILFRPYPADFDDTLTDIPKRGQSPEDVLNKKKTLSDLRENFNFKKIIQDLEELVLADSGKDEFNEIFKLIFSKIWDEKEAASNRKNNEVEFSKALDPEITYERINGLFKKACNEWPGIFKDTDNIELTKKHLQVCIAPIENLRLMGSNLRIMDDAFEYLLPTESKKKKGQFFTPRHVIEMCVRMINPTKKEFVMDPSCGSAGFLLHAMEWCYPAKDEATQELRKHRYAGKYLWGIDFEERAAKTSRALMLIAGDGHTNIFGPDVSSLDPKSWYETTSGQKLLNKLYEMKLLRNEIAKEDEDKLLIDDDLAWKYYSDLKFDVILANPPFAGEIKEKKLLANYDIAKPALKRAKKGVAKEERDVLFIERIISFLKPGGRAAIVLPQGKFNNSSLGMVREWILKRAKLLGVIGLHQNTFKPHTGTKTSVLILQKYTDKELEHIQLLKEELAEKSPDFEQEINDLLEEFKYEFDIPEEEIPEKILEIFVENYQEAEFNDDFENTSENSPEGDEEGEEFVEDDSVEDLVEEANQKLLSLTEELDQEKQKLESFEIELLDLEIGFDKEIDSITNNWKGTKKALNDELRPLKARKKEEIKALKGKQKEETKVIKTNIKSLEKLIPEVEEELNLLTNKGKLKLLVNDSELLGTLKERWIEKEFSKEMDYPVFMAVSEYGGKNNSGDYDYLTDENGNYIEDATGQPIIKQDLVNLNLGIEELNKIEELPEEELCIAEAFIKFAKKYDLDFWRED
ncbi:type I restriction endonuclease subunit M [Lysinibacillus contaminans]|uniref:Type I restriction endonuclease subunit M n=1 Tax=Lysinibacillus contaminans TaxID=1293441 RepID=A0ABR5K7A2_9BACI|nr:N-6 DNA methylase [Lysinibacillus contaminans]KOS71699.1 type I restriction endonuclease subunit M [Lysinibacillus contaminans]